MPYTLNGVGTSYWGKSNLDLHRDVCEHCGAVGDLASYDTGKYFVLLFLPLIPLGKLRILDECPKCRRHGALKLAEWRRLRHEEVGSAVTTLVEAGNPPLALLHCVSSYPMAPEDANLRAMDTLRETFGVPVGFSDHSLGITVALAAVARGAAVLEKHFTLDRSLPGPDQRASLEPDDLRSMVEGIRTVERTLGDGRKAPAAAEAETARVARKSLVAAREIQPGDIVEETDLVARRPGTGLAPSRLASVVGRKARRRIRSGEVLTLEMVE